MQSHRLVSHENWLAARLDLLAREKEFNRLRDELNEARRNLPWEKVEKNYLFEGADGKETLGQLFGDCSQLVVYHFMFDPDWEAGCKSCSFWADNFDHITPHLKARDISFVAVSRAPYAKLAAYEKRMGWEFKWMSSFGSDFNFDYAVSFKPEDVRRGQIYYSYEPRNMKMTEMVGISVFAKDEASAIYHTYSTYSRGVDMLNGAYHYIDLTPKGRDEGGKNQFWVRRHDEYGQ